MKQAFPNFSMGRVVEPELFTNREEELKIASDTLFRNEQNLLVTGERGIGKSSLLRKIYYDVEFNNINSIFPIWMDLTFLKNNSLSSFLNEIINRICIEISKRIYNIDFSDLMENINSSDETKLFGEDKYARRLYKIFRLSRSNQLLNSINVSGEIGAKFIAFAKLNESAGINSQINGLTNYEFLAIIDEINSIVNSKEFNSILLFCDESNHLTDNVNTDLLSNYFEVFKSKKLRFIFVTIPYINSRVSNLNLAFEKQILLKGFDNVSIVHDLIKKVYVNYKETGGEPIEFEEAAVYQIFNVSNGNPRIIQVLLTKSYFRAVEKNKTKINERDCTQTIIEFLKEQQEYENKMKNNVY